MYAMSGEKSGGTYRCRPAPLSRGEVLPPVVLTLGRKASALTVGVLQHGACSVGVGLRALCPHHISRRPSDTQGYLLAVDSPKTICVSGLPNAARAVLGRLACL